MQENMSDNHSPAAGEDVTAELSERLAEYLEGVNSGQTVTAAKIAGNEEWQRISALLEIPGRSAPSVARTPVDSAWNNFRLRAFDLKPAAQLEANSLGSYVTRQLEKDEKAALSESGLSKNTLEAFKTDATPLDQLKGYGLNEYAALAKRHGVKDSGFPRMLKWLKSLGKNFALPQGQPGRGMVFARDEEARQPGLDEAQLAEQLEQIQPSVKEAEAEQDKE